LIQDPPVRDSDERGSVEIAVGDKNGKELLACLKIFVEGVHPIMHRQVGRACHGSGEELMTVKDSHFTHGSRFHGMGEEGHPSLREAVLGVSDLVADFGTGERSSRGSDGNEANGILVVFGPGCVALGVGV
jgi:hypothetical protein